MLPKPGRVDNIVAAMRTILRSDKLPSGYSLTSAARWSTRLAPGLVGVGRAPLSALREWQHRKSKRHEDEPPPPNWVREALRFFVELLPALPGASSSSERRARRGGR